MRKILTLIFIFIGLSSFLIGEDDPTQTSPPDYLLKTNLTQNSRTIISVGNWVYWQYYDGKSAHSPEGEDGGFFPKNVGPVIYKDGLLFGGLLDGNINDFRIGGACFEVGLQAGWIQDDGTAVSPNDERVKIWRIRNDWRDLSLNQIKFDAMHLNELTSVSDVSDAMCQEILDQYEEDWNNWPVDLGAPYYDVDGNGVYNPDPDGDGNLGEMADSVSGQIAEDRPGLCKADQVIWYVANDLDKKKSVDFYGTMPVGIEVQATLWGYDAPSSRTGQIVYKQYKIINKSEHDMTDMYIAQWADPDIGTSGNDFAGCDPELGLGYTYNAELNDIEFLEVGVEAPPAVGYDFFLGPLVDGKAGEDLNLNEIDDAVDYGLRDFQKVGPGKINLPMTSFSWYARGSVIGDPTKGERKGGAMFYNLLRGYQPFEELSEEEVVSWTVGNMGVTPTKFPLSGDPVNDPNNIDCDGNGKYLPMGDRRILLSSGPFNFAVGDTQEIAVAVIGGHGVNNLNSITEIRKTDDIAQQIFNAGFEEIPRPPAPPIVDISVNKDKILLDWSTPESIENTENKVHAGYRFEGYNIYQLPRENALMSEAKKIACYDLDNGLLNIMEQRYLSGEYEGNAEVSVQLGTDSGIKRYLQITEDVFTGESLVEGKYYYFVVSAYNYSNTAKIVKTMESAPIVYSVRVEDAAPGEIISEIGQILDYTSYNDDANSEANDAVVEVKIINPEKLTGNSFRIDLAYNKMFKKTSWTLRNMSTNDTIIYKEDLTLNAQYPEELIFSGLKFNSISNPQNNQFKSISVVQNADGVLDEPRDAVAEDFPNTNNFFTGQQKNGAVWYIHTENPKKDEYDDFMEESVVYAGGRFVDGEEEASITNAMNYLSPRDYEIRFTGNGIGFFAWTAEEFIGLREIPFEVWCVGDQNDPEDDYQCIVWINDLDSNGVFNLRDVDHQSSPVTDDPFTDAFYIVEPQKNNQENEYDRIMDLYANNPQVTLDSDAWMKTVTFASGMQWYTKPGLSKLVFVLRNGGKVSENATYRAALPEDGTVFRFETYNSIKDGDYFTFTSPEYIAFDADTAKTQIDDIGVYPNPYYARRKSANNRYESFVTFTHLPEKAKIRIYALDGTFVDIVEKDNQKQYAEWDLRNQRDLPVASGLYLAHIELPDLNKTKVLKLMVIQKRQILDHF